MNSPDKSESIPRLDIPNFISPDGNAVSDANEALGKVFLSLPVLIQQLTDEMNVLNDSLAALALYAIRKGKADSLFEPDDSKIIDTSIETSLDRLEDDEEPTEAN